MWNVGAAGWTPVLALGVASVLLLGKPVEGQEIRVVLLRPLEAKAVPPDALQTFQQAILAPAPDVAVVPTIAEATHLIELTRYAWSLDDEFGVRQTWQFYFRPLDMSRDPLLDSSRPQAFIVTAVGKTLEESMQVSAERLREVLRKILPLLPESRAERMRVSLVRHGGPISRVRE